MNIVPVTDLRNNISVYLNKVVYTGEDILIKKGKTIVAKITRVENPSSSLLDLAGLITDKESKKVKTNLKKIKNLDYDPLRYFNPD
ncbi:type II toxin-antitoxin system Phd/YefM family antitoxin [Candidatus Gottesmanbacteria bacterium]|nr:type II toxin-antitoxin system Phd/YefM family antitoxin [Candidatus Gottesmanbacteria bacterium]MBI5452939.1 type II toxin-antitoxin system Phd/YefM family antitoxin [Candidatus Gottesmanbacteria bacterium]